MDYKEWFEVNGNKYLIDPAGYRIYRTEELYQNFKARMIAEEKELQRATAEKQRKDFDSLMMPKED